MAKRDAPVDEAYIQGYRTAQRDCLSVLAKWFFMSTLNARNCRDEMATLPGPAPWDSVGATSTPTAEQITTAVCGAKPTPENDVTGCEHKNQEGGYGLAGGGMGVYMYCTDCGHIISKTQTD